MNTQKALSIILLCEWLPVWNAMSVTRKNVVAPVTEYFLIVA